MSQPRDPVPILEAIPSVAAEYGIKTRDLKPCIACILDGNLGAAARHDACFVIAMECRRLGLDETRMQKVLRRFARKVGYSEHQAMRAIKSALTKKANGDYLYHPPGLKKKPDGKYGRVLSPFCDEVGCPANCPPFRDLYVGPRKEDMKKFDALGWTDHLKRQRRDSAIDVYRALIVLEQERGIAPGGLLIASSKQIAERAGRDPSNTRRVLHRLPADGLIEFTPGSGSGPYARDRKASRIRRVVPIPPLPRRAAIRTGGGSPSEIKGGSPYTRIESKTPAYIEGAANGRNPKAARKATP